jgi:hypothetical protein
VKTNLYVFFPREGREGFYSKKNFKKKFGRGRGLQKLFKKKKNTKYPPYPPWGIKWVF